MSTRLDLNHLIHWFNAIRKSENKNDILESFWDTQLKSKSWLVEKLNNHILLESKPKIVIHGGWNGVLASMIFQLLKPTPAMVVSIDIDPTTKKIAENINLIELNNGTFEAVVCDMAEYTYSFQPEIVINTSCEHITDNLYRRWIENIPGNPLIVCQSNNLLSVKDHITCSEDIDDFIKRLQLKTILYAESYPCSGYTRFMVIGRKND